MIFRAYLMPVSCRILAAPQGYHANKLPKFPFFWHDNAMQIFGYQRGTMLRPPKPAASAGSVPVVHGSAGIPPALHKIHYEASRKGEDVEKLDNWSLLGDDYAGRAVGGLHIL